MIDTRYFLARIRFMALAMVLTFAADALASSPTERVLYSFLTSPDGSVPISGLVADNAGNLYGTTSSGGDVAGQFGAIYELSPPATKGSPWTETVLYRFQGGSNDGATPIGSLIFDKLGNLYGTTVVGGPQGWGTVFELSPPAAQGEAWTEQILFMFPSDASQGGNPFGRLTFDGAGNLYGTAQFGGSSLGVGTVFQLKPPAVPGGIWTERDIYTFRPFQNGILDGLYPENLVFHAGSIYGTTEIGGANDQGTVFQLTPKGGVWTETILYNFTGGEGSEPIGALVVDFAGNLYGTAYHGGNAACANGCGSVFELSPPVTLGDPWLETTLYSFAGGKDGASPYAGVIRDKSGDLFGSAAAGGSKGQGVLFKLIPPASPAHNWTEVTMHEFQGGSEDGSAPFGQLILMNGKGFYGTTSAGGTAGLGTVFNLLP